MKFLSKSKSTEISQENTQDARISVKSSSIEIEHQGSPIKGSISNGYVYLVIDRSSSMAGDKIKQAQKGSTRFAREALEKSYFTGLIQFDSSPQLLCEPVKDLTLINRAIENLSIGDTTHMAKAIDMSTKLLTGLSGPRTIVIVTDGMPNGVGDPEATLKSANNAKAQGIDIMTIGTDDADQSLLQKLATRSDLAKKVDSNKLGVTIAGTAKLLPPVSGK